MIGFGCGFWFPGSAVRGGEGAVFFGRVVAGGVHADDLTVAGQLPARLTPSPAARQAPGAADLVRQGRGPHRRPAGQRPAPCRYAPSSPCAGGRPAEDRIRCGKDTGLGRFPPHLRHQRRLADRRHPRRRPARLGSDPCYCTTSRGWPKPNRRPCATGCCASPPAWSAVDDGSGSASTPPGPGQPNLPPPSTAAPPFPNPPAEPAPRPRPPEQENPATRPGEQSRARPVIDPNKIHSGHRNHS
jgi:hypothetical protein